MTTKKRIVIASLLKPVNDARNYEKLAVSLAKIEKYEVTGIGISPTEYFQSNNNIKYQSIGTYNRSWGGRFFNQLKIVFLCIKLKPHLFFMTTIELYPCAWILKIIFNTKVIYDVQENYQANIQHQEIYRGYLKIILTKIVAVFNKRIDAIVSHYLLSEKCYENELNLEKNQITVLENKYVGTNHPVLKKNKKDKVIRIIFSGSISYYSGLDRVVKYFKKLKCHLPQATLSVIGFAPEKKVKMHFLNSENDPSIEWEIKDIPMDHYHLIDVVKKADIGIIGYVPDKVNKNRMPSKLFEYAALQKVILVQRDTYWLTRSKTMSWSIGIDLINYSICPTLPNSILDMLQHPPHPNYMSANWEGECNHLQKTVGGIINGIDLFTLK